MSRTVLVTGASGRLGRRLLPVLAAAGWRTRALVRRTPVADSDEVVEADVVDGRGVDAACSGVDAILHLAAVTHSRRAGRYFDVNVDGTRNLAAAAERQAVRRFVFVSSRAVSKEGGAYSRSKLAAEDVVRAMHTEFTIVRLPDVYGVGGREGVERIVESARAGRPIPLVGRGQHEVCPVHVDDVLSALVVALDAPAAAGKTYTLAGGCISMREFAAACAEHFGRGSRVLQVPETLIRIAGLASHIAPLPLYPDQLARLNAPKPAPSPAALTDLGFAPRDLANGLRSFD